MGFTDYSMISNPGLCPNWIKWGLDKPVFSKEKAMGILLFVYSVTLTAKISVENLEKNLAVDAALNSCTPMRCKKHTTLPKTHWRMRYIFESKRNTWLNNNKYSPFVNSGSGSFRKKDFKRLLITFRSCHLWAQGKKKRLFKLDWDAF